MLREPIVSLKDKLYWNGRLDLKLGPSDIRGRDTAMRRPHDDGLAKVLELNRRQSSAHLAMSKSISRLLVFGRRRNAQAPHRRHFVSYAPMSAAISDWHPISRIPSLKKNPAFWPWRAARNGCLQLSLLSMRRRGQPRLFFAQSVQLRPLLEEKRGIFGPSGILRG